MTDERVATDAEVDELRAEVKRLREHVAQHLRDYIPTSDTQGVNPLTGDLAVDMAAYAGRLRARAEAAEAKVAKVEVLHWPHNADVFVSGTQWCDVDGDDWPCPTVRVARGEVDVDPHPSIVDALEERAALAEPTEQ